MARSTTGSNYLIASSPSDPGGVGSIFIRAKPTWSSGNSTRYYLWKYRSSGVAELGFQHYTDNNLYVGWYTPTDSRVAISDSGLFSSGTWGNWLFDWSDVSEQSHLYLDNVLKGTATTAFTAVGSFLDFSVGNDPTSNCGADSDIAEVARWDHVLDSTERATLQSTGNPACLSTGLVHHYKILGNDSPEPDEVGTEDLTLVGTPAQSTHPSVGTCSSDQTATLPQLAAGGSLYAPTVVPATLTLTLPRIEATESIYSPTVSAGAVTAVLPAISADGAAYAPTVAPGTVTETLPLITASGAVYAPTVVEAGTVADLPQLAANGAFYSPTIIFDQTMTLPQLAAAGAFYAPGVVENLAAGIRLTTSNAPVLNLTLVDASVLWLTVDDDLAEG